LCRAIQPPVDGERTPARSRAGQIALDGIARVTLPAPEQFVGVPHVQIGIPCRPRIRRQQPPPALVLEDRRIDAGEIVDQRAFFVPAVRKRAGGEDADATACAGFRNAQDLAVVPKQIRIREMIGHRERLVDDEVAAVAEIHVTDLAAIRRVRQRFEETELRAAVLDQERIGAKGVPAVDRQPRNRRRAGQQFRRAGGHRADAPTIVPVERFELAHGAMFPIRFGASGPPEQDV
jgi:hypothetical protein